MSQEEVGLLAGYPVENAQSRIARYEANNRTPDYDEVRKFSRILKTTELYIIYGDLAKHLNVSQSLPILTWKALDLMDDRRDSNKKLSVFWPTKLSDESFVLPIENDDLAPHFMKGDVIVIDPSVVAKHGDFVVMAHHHTQPVVCEMVINKRVKFFKKLERGSAPVQEEKNATRVYGVVISKITSLR